ncbi:MAG: hypothetical protein CMJ78_06755 [Planctomycetaceae bacterium]|nr:hypothetical protein [Planctomycetaceae bacterium]
MFGPSQHHNEGVQPLAAHAPKQIAIGRALRYKFSVGTDAYLIDRQIGTFGTIVISGPIENMRNDPLRLRSRGGMG